MADANIKAVITAKDEASSVLRKFGDESSSLGHKVAFGLKAAAVATAAAGTAAVAFGALSVKAYSESENAIAQTNAVLKSTGGIAGVTAEEVTKLANALQKTTKYSDEEVRSAENLLLTFTSISKDIFPDATKIVLDMSTALGQDLKSSSIQVGKALQDPVLGITALRRVGVNFSDKQKDVIQSLVETGHKAEAQKLILKELKKEFGGSAEAAGNTFAGALAKLKNQFDDIQEVIGQVITQRLAPFITAASNVLASIDWSSTMDNMAVKIQDWGNRISEVAVKIGDYLKPKLEALWNTLTTQVLPAIGNFAQAFGPAAGTGLTAFIGLTIDALNLFLKVLTPIINFLADNTWVVWGIVAAFVALRTALFIEKAVAAFSAGMAIVEAAALAAGGTVNGVTVATGLAKIGLGALAGPWAITILIGAALAALALVYQKGLETLALLDRLANKKASVLDADSKAYQQIRDAEKSGKISHARAAELFRQLDPLARASGGPVNSGQLYMVGEQGPELFVPRQSGTIVDAKTTSGAMSGAPINITLQAGFFNGSDVEARKYAMTIVEHLKDIASSRGTTVAQMIG